MKIVMPKIEQGKRSTVSKYMETNRICLFNEVSSLCDADIKAEIDEIVWQMTHGAQIVPMKIEDLQYLYEENVIVKRRFCSFVESQEGRLENIACEMKKHEPFEKNSYEHVLILIQTSKEYPLMMSELQVMNDVIEGFSPKTDIRWGLGTNDDLEYRMFIMLVCSKK